MHRFYLPPEQCKGSTLFLTGPEAHHASHVLRLRRGERVVVLDGAGHEFSCDVGASDRDKIKLTVATTQSIPHSPCQVTLLQAVPKGKLIESIIQKATELGVARILPLLSERVVSHVAEKEAARKAAKWQVVAIEAIKQCGSPWLPRIEAPLSPAQFLARKEKFDLPFIASLQSGARHPRVCFRAFASRENRLPASACVWIGPEGDFTPDEVAAITAEGALPITLGKLVLRTETAAIYCLSILNYELESPSVLRD
jgi:16S rRNA (uracil1498-N3)-methyltransferase